MPDGQHRVLNILLKWMDIFAIVVIFVYGVAAPIAIIAILLWSW